MTAFRQLEYESALASLKVEKFAAITKINLEYCEIRANLIHDRNVKLAALKKVYNDAITVNKCHRRELWAEKCRIENTFPVDVDAIADNIAQSNELHRQAGVLTEQLSKDISDVKSAYYAKKHELQQNEKQELAALEQEFNNKRIQIFTQFTKEGGDA